MLRLGAFLGKTFHFCAFAFRRMHARILISIFIRDNYEVSFYGSRSPRSQFFYNET